MSGLSSTFTETDNSADLDVFLSAGLKKSAMFDGWEFLVPSFSLSTTQSATNEVIETGNRVASMSIDDQDNGDDDDDDDDDDDEGDEVETDRNSIRAEEECIDTKASTSKNKKKRSKKKKKKTKTKLCSSDKNVQWGSVEEICFSRTVSFTSIPNKGKYPIGLGAEEERTRWTVDEHVQAQQQHLMELATTLGLSTPRSIGEPGAQGEEEKERFTGLNVSKEGHRSNANSNPEEPHGGKGKNGARARSRSLSCDYDTCSQQHQNNGQHKKRKGKKSKHEALSVPSLNTPHSSTQSSASQQQCTHEQSQLQPQPQLQLQPQPQPLLQSQQQQQEQYKSYGKVPHDEPAEDAAADPLDTVFETRQYDYRRRCSNALFRPMDEMERIQLLSNLKPTGSHLHHRDRLDSYDSHNSHDSHDSHLSTAAVEHNGQDRQSPSAGGSDTGEHVNSRQRSNSHVMDSVAAMQHGAVSSHMLMEVNREVNAIKADRGTSGCSCKPTKIDKLSVAKMKAELLHRDNSCTSSNKLQEYGQEQNPDNAADAELFCVDKAVLDKMSKVELTEKVRQVLKHCPICVEHNCECVAAGVACNAQLCGCLRSGHHKAEYCANPNGQDVFNFERVQHYRREIILMANAAPERVVDPANVAGILPLAGSTAS